MPVFQASTRSRNGVRVTTPRVAQPEAEQQPELARLIERGSHHGNGETEAGEGTPEHLGHSAALRMASHSRSARASRGDTSG